MTAFRVHVEGNIACGKTTLLRSFEQISDFTTLLEPVDEWQTMSFREYTPNLLEKFYKDPHHHAEAFQQVVMHSYIPIHDFEAPTAIKIMERSMHSSVIFRHVLLQKGILSEQQESELHAQYRQFCTPKTDAELILYLRTTPENCFRRLHDRNREEESEVTLDYLTMLHAAHEEWVLCSPFPLVIINAEQSMQTVQQQSICAIFRAFAENRIRKHAPPILPTV
jgi:deoxyadenosine/deoxycytidine kinase